MKLMPLFSCCLFALLSTSLFAADSNQQIQLRNQALSLVQQFGGTLKPQLKQAIANGGLAHAIEICSNVAPTIAADLSTKSGWQIKRVSLKARNPQALPDDWERAVLVGFESSPATAPLEHAALLDGRFRFIKAQTVEPLCLNCHGAHLAPAVISALREHYPGDTATGYNLGDIRGAFSLSKTVE